MMGEVKFYGRLALRRMPIMLTLIILCTTAGLIQAVRLPATFESSARLAIEGRQISDDLVDAVVEVAADEEIQLIRERLLTRANLLEIANEFDVFENRAEMTPDIVVERMMASTQILSRGGRNQATLITVTFGARSGQIAADVVNEYVTRIINESVTLRDVRSGGTREFFEQQVQRLSSDLDARSAEISSYQVENADALPGDQNYRLSRQSTLQERMASAQRELSSLIDQRARIIEIYESTGQVNASETILSDDERQLLALERELASLLTIYSESAPQVITMRRRVEQLRDLVAAASPTTDGEAAVNPSQAVLDLQLDQIDVQIASLESVIGEASSELEGLVDAISRAPLVAITLESMERDYERIESQYNREVERLNQAITADDINVSRLGQRITQIEDAHVPAFPAKPNRKLIALIGAVAGVGLAGAFFAAMEVLNRTVRRQVEITRPLGIEPLAVVPYIETQRERLGRIFWRVGTTALVLFGLPAGLWFLDTQMPLDQLAGEILARLGIS